MNELQRLYRAHLFGNPGLLSCLHALPSRTMACRCPQDVWCHIDLLVPVLLLMDAIESAVYGRPGWTDEQLLSRIQRVFHGRFSSTEITAVFRVIREGGPLARQP
jgi:hypothetical protein